MGLEVKTADGRFKATFVSLGRAMVLIVQPLLLSTSLAVHEIALYNKLN